MKKNLLFFGSLVFCSLTCFAKLEKSEILRTGFPSDKLVKSAQDDQDYQRALTAYRFWYPTVSAESIFNGNREIGVGDQNISVVAAQPYHIGFTLNSDTPYGGGVLDLKNGPMVIDVPPGMYIGLVNDHNQKWILDFGLPGPNAGKGGKHLILPPNYSGDIPKGYQIGRSATYKNLVAIRALPTDGDMNKAIQALSNIKIYPLSNPKQLVKMVNTTAKKMDSTPLRVEDNIQYWQTLHKVISEEPTNPEYTGMYGLLESLGLERGKTFNPDSRMKGILERAARDGKAQMIVAAFADRRAERIAWKDRKWEWVGYVSTNGNFATPDGVDIQARDRWFAQAIVTSPAMFARVAGAGSLYWMGLRDSKGAFLDGGKSYKLTVPYPVPNRLFWSVTVYDAKTRSQVQTSQNKAALRSLVELSDISEGTKEVNLYFGPKAPAGKERYWIQTTPGKGWFAYFRIYGPTAPAFDGTWRPGDFESTTFSSSSERIGLNQ
ncbi:DUF1254 domain-containing protein [Bdellovibrio sp. ZAP7]|uniref:DUF1254 domain-containing protein n=1 Tax=Bdellovibrio sp. ZAP7 TaxID=2231053 RepID=UPI0011597204|nr:DUF1254 domain-containing protein [Bdellovibrio sp. ZAP7]QDK46704.1 DUF1254 domain-containing protein [Bdellovibrio sp. ZAP7]